MWSLNVGQAGFHRLLVLSLIPTLIFLSACGFEPIYGSRDLDSSPVGLQLNQVAIGAVPDRQGQMLRNDLIDRMYVKGRPITPRYTLDLKLHNIEEDLGIQADATSSRSLLNMYGDYTLRDSDGKTLTSGSAHSVASFDKLSQQYGTQIARDSAIENTINEVAEQIVNRISLYLSENPYR